MKGKYANAADKRREMDALEARAVAAERQHESAAADFARERERVSREIMLLKERLKAVTAERDAGQGPLVAALQTECDNLREDLQATRQEFTDVLDLRRAISQSAMRALMVCGLTFVEAQEVLLNGIEGKPKFTRLIATAKSDLSRLTTDQALTLQRSRGQRGTDPPAAETVILARMAADHTADLDVRRAQ